MESTPYRQLAPSIGSGSKNSSISSDKDLAASAAASSRYTAEENADAPSTFDFEANYGTDDDEDIGDGAKPSNSNITKRPSMYHSETSSAPSGARTSRRQNLLNRRSQTLQQVDEMKSLTPSSASPPATAVLGGKRNMSPSPAPKFIVTNPDPVSDKKKKTNVAGDSDDLKNFVNLMNSKGTKLSPEEIYQLKALGKQPPPGMSRTSMLSQYSGVVEEVEEFQQIKTDKPTYIPSLVEVASTVHKRGPSSSNSNSSKDELTQAVLHKKTRNNDDDEEIMGDSESIKSVESIVNLGPLPTTGVQSTSTVRSPDLSLSTEIDPTIPPRSSRRPRSQIILSPSGSQAQLAENVNRHQSSASEQISSSATPTRESKRSSVIGKRLSLPPPTSEAPLTPTQLRELQESGQQTPPRFDYATILNKRNSDLSNRKRISSSNRPLPEIPKDEEKIDQEEVEVLASAPSQDSETVDVVEIMQELKQDATRSLDDQTSEKPINTDEVNKRKSIISDETLESQQVTTFHVKTATIQSPLEEEFEEPKAIIDPASSNNSSERKIRFPDLPSDDEEENRNYKYAGKSYSVSSFNTDNASFHTADDLEQKNSAESKNITAHEDFEDDGSYEDIEVVVKPRETKKKHKKKSSSSSSNSKKLRPFSISTLSKLLESTDGVIIGEEFDNLDISNDEKKYIEKIVDVIARLTADMVADPSRHDGTINRMKAALRILEGFD